VWEGLGEVKREREEKRRVREGLGEVKRARGEKRRVREGLGEVKREREEKRRVWEGLGEVKRPESAHGSRFAQERKCALARPNLQKSGKVHILRCWQL